jgi:hypothetical protein
MELSFFFLRGFVFCEVYAKLQDKLCTGWIYNLIDGLDH